MQQKIEKLLIKISIFLDILSSHACMHTHRSRHSATFEGFNDGAMHQMWRCGSGFKNNTTLSETFPTQSTASKENSLLILENYFASKENHIMSIIKISFFN